MPPPAALPPPAHRWVRAASKVRGGRAREVSDARDQTESPSASSDDSTALTIRDIIRQRNQEERAAEGRARAEKRKVDAALPPGERSGKAGKGGGGGDDSKGGDSAPPALPGPAAPTTMAPQVTIVDGQIVINEQSLIVNAAHERATELSEFTRVEEQGMRLNSATYANYTKVRAGRIKFHFVNYSREVKPSCS